MSAWILRPIQMGGAGISAHLQQGTAPGANLADPQPKIAWAIPAQGSSWVTSLLVDLGTDWSIDTLALLYHNGSPAGRWSAWGRTSAQGPFAGFFNTAGAHEFFFEAPWRQEAAGFPQPARFHALHVASAVVNMRYLCIQPQSLDASNPSWFAGVLAVGWRIQPGGVLGGFDWGAGRRVNDLSAVRVLDGGERGIWRRTPLPEFRGSWSHLTDLELARLWATLRAAGESEPLLIAEAPDTLGATGAHERIHYGTLTGLDFFERRQSDKSRIDLRLQHWL